MDENWVVNGLKMIRADQLEQAIKEVIETVKLHSCDFIDWHVEADKSNC